MICTATSNEETKHQLWSSFNWCHLMTSHNVLKITLMLDTRRCCQFDTQYKMNQKNFADNVHYMILLFDGWIHIDMAWYGGRFKNRCYFLSPLCGGFHKATLSLKSVSMEGRFKGICVLRQHLNLRRQHWTNVLVLVVLLRTVSPVSRALKINRVWSGHCFETFQWRLMQCLSTEGHNIRQPLLR